MISGPNSSKIHDTLDYEYIGVDSSVPRSLLTLNRAVLVNATEAAATLEVAKRYPHVQPKISPLTYRGMIESLTEEAIPFVAEDEAAARFIDALGRDHRFWPRISRRTEGAWTYFTPSYNMYEDAVEVLTEQIESFVLGYYMTGISDGILTPHRLIGLKDDEARSLDQIVFDSVTVREFEDLELNVRFDEIATARWQSAQHWMRFAGMLEE